MKNKLHDLNWKNWHKFASEFNYYPSCPQRFAYLRREKRDMKITIKSILVFPTYLIIKHQIARAFQNMFTLLKYILYFEYWWHLPHVPGQNNGTQQTTFISGPDATSGPLSLGGPFGCSFPQPKSAVLRRIPVGGSARRPRVRRPAGEMRLPALVEQRCLSAGALSGKRPRYERSITSQ